MNGTKYWTWHMAAGVVILFLLGLHMMIMHLGATTHLFAPNGGESVSIQNSLFRDGQLFFSITYILLLGLGLYHGLYGLRTMVFELTLKPPPRRPSPSFWCWSAWDCSSWAPGEPWWPTASQWQEQGGNYGTNQHATDQLPRNPLQP